jgi:hypothetical protein
MIPDQPNEEASERRPPKPGGIFRRALAPNVAAEEQLLELLAERRRELEEHAGRFEEQILDLEHREQLLSDERASVERLLRRGTTELEARERDLMQLERELADREGRLRQDEAEMLRRRGELGAVELKRASLEQRERVLDARDADLAAREAEVDARETELASERAAADEPGPGLLFVPGAAYRLVERGPAPAAAGSPVEVDGVEYVVSRVGASPLPNDGRRCAYLVRGAPRVPPSGGSL